MSSSFIFCQGVAGWLLGGTRPSRSRSKRGRGARPQGIARNGARCSRSAGMQRGRSAQGRLRTEKVAKAPFGMRQ
jgi:hypothetical protein